MFIRFLKNWTLPISMITGGASYFICRELPFTIEAKADIVSWIEIIQPVLLFIMLFIAFCKVTPKDIRPKRWHIWLALIQSTLFSLSCFLLWMFPTTTVRYAIEGFLLSMICPTATACAVVTQKLGGDSATTTSYTILINMVVALLAPVLLPLTQSHTDITFATAFVAIIKKVFPLLMLPLFLAWAVRFLLPRIHKAIISTKDLAFYIWAVSLALAIAVTCRALAHSDESIWHVIAIAVATFIACMLQFHVGKKIGTRYGFRLEGGQAMGQKNTIFIIWLGYTFLSPISATAGGFYSIWHNVVNSYQLYRKRKEQPAA